MLFSEIIGQDKFKRILTDAVEANRLSHALLFLAPEGAGGLPMALALAQYMVCENRQKGDSCGQCPACKKAAQLIHPDIHFTYPVVPRKSGDKPVSADYAKEWKEFVKKTPYANAYQWLQYIEAGNRQGNITRRECSEILRNIGLKAYESEYKICIIWHAEALKKEGNSLLKSIEEPPDKTIFILVASQADQILNTIRSRTQLLRLPRLKEEEIQTALKERYHIPEEEAGRMAALAEGDYNEALHLIDKNVSSYLPKLKEWLNAILGKDPTLLKDWIAGSIRSTMGREDLKQFLKYFIRQLEHVLRLEYRSNTEFALAKEERQFVQTLAKMTDFFQIKEMIDLLDDASYHIERNANEKILFHALSIRLKYIFKREAAPLLNG